ncbi:MAG: hypothetical protein ACI9LG_001694 [Moritella dasanensis]|jgi:hypothetical protein
MFIGSLCLLVLWSPPLLAIEYEELNQLPAACLDNAVKSESVDELTPCFSSTLSNNPNFLSVMRSAYHQFSALSWPLKNNSIGMPNYEFKGLQFASAGEPLQLKDNFPVWQSWPTMDQFKYQGSSNWDTREITIPKACDYLFKTDKDNNSAYKKFIKQYSQVPRGPKIEILSDYRNAMHQVLLDTNNKSVRYQVYMNKPAFDYLNNTARDKALIFPKGGIVEGQNMRGAIIVKAAWKILTEREQKDYHKSFALVTSDKDRVDLCSLEVVGLSALHIANKNNNIVDSPEGSNEWSWATYEFKGNAPVSIFKDEKISLTQDQIEPVVGDSWGFFNLAWQQVKKDCSARSSDDKSVRWDPNLPTCPINKYISQCEDPSDAGCTHSNLVSSSPEQLEYDPKYGELFNNDISTMFSGYVWKNYQIINSQWLNNCEIGCTFEPKVLLNPILEPFIDPLKGDINSRSCMDCHATANMKRLGNPDPVSTDYIFMSRKATQAIPINLYGNKIDLSIFNTKGK